MKATKKILSTALASALIVSTGATAFAAMPAETVVYKDLNKATGLTNLDVSNLVDELDDADKNDMFFKYDDTTWINLDDPSTVVDVNDIPAVTRYNEDGTTTEYMAGDGDEVSETATIESVEAITTTKVRVKFSNKIDTATAANFTIGGYANVTIGGATLQEDMKTVDLTVSPIQPQEAYSLTATGILVNGQAQEVMTKEFTAPTAAELYSGTTLVSDKTTLKADGAAGSTVTFELKDAEGNLIEDADNVVVEFKTTFGKFAEKRVTVTNGKAEVYFTSETLTATKVALLQGIIVEAADQNLINIKAEANVILDPNPTGDDGDVILGARVTEVESGQADRIFLYFDKEVTPSMYTKDDGTVDTTKAEITVTDNVKNDLTGGKELAVKGFLPIEGNKKGLQLLLDTESLTTPGPHNNILTTNSRVKVDFTDKNGDVALPSTGLSFNFTDKRTPEMTKVDVDGLKSVKVTFSEAVSTIDDAVGATTPALQATEPTNWSIDGIRLDNTTKWGNGATATVGTFNPATGVDERNIVTITLGTDNLGKQKYFGAGDHVIQGANIGDWAGVTDQLNNRMNTQNLDFTVVADTSKPVATVEVQSPEQWLVKFDKDIDGSELDFANKVTLERFNESNSTWETVTTDGNAADSVTSNDATIGQDDDLDIVVTKIGDREFLVETDLDWTVNHDSKQTNKNYYQYNYRLNLQSAAVTNPINGLANDSTMLNLTGSIMEDKDFVSPEIVSIGEASTTIKTDLAIAESQQAYVASISEPIKLRLTDTTGANNEGATDSQNQGYDPANNDDWANISQATATFVRKSDKKTVKGNVIAISDNYDKEVVIVPVDQNGAQVNLEVGTWSLSLSGLSDDVLNTISSKDQEFVVEGEGPVTTDFEILWAYADKHADADDDVIEYDQDNTDALDKDDAIYIKFSKEVDITGIESALDTGKFLVNGNVLPQGSTVIANISGYDNHDNIIDSVTIMLPDDTITDVNTTTLNVSPQIVSTSNEALKISGEFNLSYRFAEDTDVKEVETMAEFTAAMADTTVREIKLTDNVFGAETLAFTRLVNLDLNGNNVDEITVDSEEKGSFTLAGGTVDSFTIDAPNADLNVLAGATITNLTVTDLYANSVNVLAGATVTNVTLNDSTTINNNGTVGVVNVTSGNTVTIEGTTPPETIVGEGSVDVSVSDDDAKAVLDAKNVAQTATDNGANLVVTFAEALPTGVTVSVCDTVDGIFSDVTVGTDLKVTTVTGNVYFKYTSNAKSVTEMVYGN